LIPLKDKLFWDVVLVPNEHVSIVIFVIAVRAISQAVNVCLWGEGGVNLLRIGVVHSRGNGVCLGA
jgi:hypothetical protein